MTFRCHTTNEKSSNFGSKCLQIFTIIANVQKMPNSFFCPVVPQNWLFFFPGCFAFARHFVALDSLLAGTRLYILFFKTSCRDTRDTPTDSYSFCHGGVSSPTGTPYPLCCSFIRSCMFQNCSSETSLLTRNEPSCETGEFHIMTRS